MKFGCKMHVSLFFICAPLVAFCGERGLAADKEDEKNCCQCNTESECNTNDCDCRSTLTRCNAGCRAERCSNSKVTTRRTECCWCNEESECNTKHCDCRKEGEECIACVTRSCKNRCCQCDEDSVCLTDTCRCHKKDKNCTSCLAKWCFNRCCLCDEDLECNTDTCLCYNKGTPCTSCQAKSCKQRCCQCDEDSECNTDTCRCHDGGTPCTSCLAKSCKQRCCKCNTESECNTNDCDCQSTLTRCDAGCYAERCSNSKVTTSWTECCWCNEDSECNTEDCDCHEEGGECTNCVTRSCKNRCCQCDEDSGCNTDTCRCLHEGKNCTSCLAEMCENRCCKCNTESECNTNDCDCRSTLTRCNAGCRAERCSNSKVTTRRTECCWCNEESECNTKHCDCHEEGEECIACVTRSCKNRCCQCDEDLECNTDTCRCYEEGTHCTSCLAKSCKQRCCQCNTESECNTNDCDCRSTLTRCNAGCRAERCSNSKVTTALTECCQCNGESECNSNNCACHSRHTRCSANCFAGGCTNNKLTGECEECCQCNEESQCDSEYCACHSEGSHCSPRCFATGCANHKTVMGQKVDLYLSKEQVQVLAKSQTTSDAERKTTRPITLDTTQTSSIPASCQGSAPDNETEFLNAWFPRLDTQPYIIPPVHFDTVHVRKVNLAGGHSINVLKTQEEREQGQDKNSNKTVKIDRILKKIHYCLSHIKQEAAKQRELMVIMSQAKCSLFGANSTSLYTGVAAMSTNSSDRETLDLREEFVDLLVIHRQQGILMAATIQKTEENPETLQGDIRKAVDYLEKAKQVVEDCVVNDVTPKPAIHRAVLLPNVTRDCLQGQLVKMNDLRELEQRLGVEPGRRFSEFCLCDDDMADETRVERWWTTCLKRDAGADRPMMGQDVYRQLVTKFVTPLTTVQMYLSTEPRLQLWTLHDVVQAVGEEHGRDLSRIALFPRQLELVEDLPDQNKDDVIILYGPPGSAKTFLLLIKGVLWLKERCKKVFVVQTRPKDGAASAFLVAHQLEKTAAQGPNGVQLVNTQDFWDSKKETWTQGGEVKYQAWVQQLCDHARDNPTGAVHILADEANCDHVSSIVKTLHHRGVRVNLWAAGVKLDIPADLQDNVRMLTEPLRSPPSVVREVEKANDMKNSTVPAYSVPPVAPPCDGPPLITIIHYNGRRGHEASIYPWRCEECTKQVARVLLHDLHVGRRDNAAPGLKYNDVFVTGSEIDCGTNTPDGNDYSPAPFIRGLQSAGIPTRQVSRDDRDAIRRVAENAWPATATGATGGGEDAVTVVNESTVWGLERKVVVYMETAEAGFGRDSDYYGRLLSFSRATSQVIFVKYVY